MKPSTFILAFFILTSVLAGKITNLLKNELSLRGGKTDILIHLQQQVDFSQVKNEKGILAEEIENEDERGYFVMKTLQENAKSQKPLKKLLKQKNFKFTSFWISNLIFVKDATEELIFTLGKRKEVQFMEVNKSFKVDLGIPLAGNAHLQNISEPEWNIKWIKGDQVWNRGFEGKGIVVGVSDTGIQYDHPALLKSYRGFNEEEQSLNHNYNWFDATPNLTEIPEDDNGHGTFVTGLASGGNDGRKSEIF
jgi:bacillopeptidase F